MMARELGVLLDAQAAAGHALDLLTLDMNVLGRPTHSARRLVLNRLRSLYGLGSECLVSKVLTALWPLDPVARPLLALLCAVARDPLLRESGELILSTLPGSSLRWPLIAAQVEARFPGRFSPKMLKSLSQNCASTWTQSGHLEGKVNKVRSRVAATPTAAAYAALLGSIAGFGGPALLDSPWLRVLDNSWEQRLALLRQAATSGLIRIKAAGGVMEIAVRQPMAQALGMSELAEL